jgi:hypothetical protein
MTVLSYRNIAEGPQVDQAFIFIVKCMMFCVVECTHCLLCIDFAKLTELLPKRDDY